MKSEVKEEIQTYIRYINENDLRDKCEEYIQMFFFLSQMMWQNILQLFQLCLWDFILDCLHSILWDCILHKVLYFRLSSIMHLLSSP